MPSYWLFLWSNTKLSEEASVSGNYGNHENWSWKSSRTHSSMTQILNNRSKCQTKKNTCRLFNIQFNCELHSNTFFNRKGSHLQSTNDISRDPSWRTYLETEGALGHCSAWWWLTELLNKGGCTSRKWAISIRHTWGVVRRSTSSVQKACAQGFLSREGFLAHGLQFTLKQVYGRSRSFCNLGLISECFLMLVPPGFTIISRSKALALWACVRPHLGSVVAMLHLP